VRARLQVRVPPVVTICATLVNIRSRTHHGAIISCTLAPWDTHRQTRR